MKNVFSAGRYFTIPTIALLFILINSNNSFAQGKKQKNESVLFDTITTNIQGMGTSLTIEFRKGPEHNHPLMAIWIEDLDGNYIQTLYVAKSIAKGVFAFGDKSTGKWQEGEIIRVAALPYWSHKRNIKNDLGNYMPKKGFEVPDAYTGATPKSDFTLATRADNEISNKFRIYFEINQSWDWNKHWTNTLYPDDPEYKTSSQPAVVYAAVIDPSVKGVAVRLEPVGRSHQSGENGNLYTDLETLTTALRIASEITVTVNAE
ncbi:MAG: hypothetical protein HGA37_09330 [Lentimicrobium sp.]|nr:hypothetical protein [Lentimicrobium sp.]